MQFVASRASDPVAGCGGKTCDNFRRAVRSFTDGRSKSDGPSGQSTAPSSTSPPELDPSRLNPKRRWIANDWSGAAMIAMGRGVDGHT